jgi:hypothetical protein
VELSSVCVVESLSRAFVKEVKVESDRAPQMRSDLLPNTWHCDESGWAPRDRSAVTMAAASRRNPDMKQRESLYGDTATVIHD